VQGWGAWPACSRKLGLTSAHKSGSPSVAADGVKRASRSKVTKKQPARSTPVKRYRSNATYVVRSGDTLSKIADRLNVAGGWQALYARNRHVVGDNPNLIFPGQRLSAG
jgi:nucleoid-associated protein YgaU